MAAFFEPGSMAKTSEWKFKPSQAGWGEYETMLGAMQTALEGREYLLGDRFTMADVIFGGTIRFMLMVKMIEPRPAFTAYAERLIDDLAGLDCKGGEDWSAPPGDDDVGLDAVASLPEMTDVGGTTLSTDHSGVWGAEQVWFDPAVIHGTGGGVSTLFERPYWQEDLRSTRGAGQQLTPDVAAVSDPFTGVKIVKA